MKLDQHNGKKRNKIITEIRIPEKKESDLVFSVYQNSETAAILSLYVEYHFFVLLLIVRERDFASSTPAFLTYIIINYGDQHRAEKDEETSITTVPEIDREIECLRCYETMVLSSDFAIAVKNATWIYATLFHWL